MVGDGIDLRHAQLTRIRRSGIDQIAPTALDCRPMKRGRVEARRRGGARRRAARHAATSRSRTAASSAAGSPARTAAASRCPGFVDLQVNGFGGVDFLDADADGYRRAGEALLETGVTAYLPTLITSPEEHAARRARRGADRRRRTRASSACTSRGRSSRPRRLGTHVASARRDPDLGAARRLLDGGPGAADDARARAARRRRADRAAARARRDRVARPQQRDGRAGQRRVRPAACAP